MGKTAIATPLYISVAWTLMTTYQLFTQTTVTTATIWIHNQIPTIGEWLLTKTDMIIFIHSFAWIFLLSSVIPGLLLGKERGVLSQFGLCLTLAFLAFLIQDALTSIGVLDQIMGVAPILQNPLLALAYLSVPYVLMLWLDVRGRRKKQKAKTEQVETETEEQPETQEDAFAVDEEFFNEEEWEYAKPTH